MCPNVITCSFWLRLPESKKPLWLSVLTYPLRCSCCIFGDPFDYELNFGSYLLVATSSSYCSVLLFYVTYKRSLIMAESRSSTDSLRTPLVQYISNAVHHPDLWDQFH